MSGIFGASSAIVSGSPTGLSARGRISTQAIAVGGWGAMALGTFTGQSWLSAGGVLTLPAGFSYSIFASLEYSAAGIAYVGVGIGGTAPPSTFLFWDKSVTASFQVYYEGCASGTYIFVGYADSAVNAAPSSISAANLFLEVRQFNP
jgi:hypothetical protein